MRREKYFGQCICTQMHIVYYTMKVTFFYLFVRIFSTCCLGYCSKSELVYSCAQLALELMPDSPILVASCGADVCVTTHFYSSFLSLLILITQFAVLKITHAV